MSKQSQRIEKIKKMNKDHPLDYIKRGFVVKDYDNHRGVVVKIVPGTDNENHGTIYVWQMDRWRYGADNCEHYVFFDWRESLEILEVNRE